VAAYPAAYVSRDDMADARDHSGRCWGAEDAVRGRVGGALVAKAKGLAKSLVESLDILEWS
jgi:hypothetical protein